MDAKPAFEAVVAATSGIRETVSTDQLTEFDELVAQQYGHAVETAGPVAVANQVQTPETDFEASLKQFLDPEAEMSAEEQLDFMAEFWNKLGTKTPELDETQRAKLTEVIERNPHKRVVLTPLQSIDQRKANAERARQFPGSQFADGVSALWTPSEETIYGRLLRQPNVPVKEGRTDYALRYKTPGGETVARLAFENVMVEEGHAVLGEDGTTWLFPVMEAQVESERSYTTAESLYEQVDPSVVQESLEAMQLLHQANGTPNPRWHVDFANGAVYKIDKHGSPKALARVAGVFWRPSGRQVGSYAWDADYQDGDFGVRGAESGIKA